MCGLTTCFSGSKTVVVSLATSLNSYREIAKTVLPSAIGIDLALVPLVTISVDKFSLGKYLYLDILDCDGDWTALQYIGVSKGDFLSSEIVGF